MSILKEGLRILNLWDVGGSGFTDYKSVIVSCKAEYSRENNLAPEANRL